MKNKLSWRTRFWSGICIFILLFNSSVYSISDRGEFLVNKGMYMSLGANSPLSDIEKVIRLRMVEPKDEFGFSFYEKRVDSQNLIEVSVNKKMAYQIRFSGKKFKTDRGIKIGDTFAKVRKKYPESEAQYSGDEGGYLVVMVKPENIIFSFNRDNIEAYEDSGKLTDEFLNNKKLESIILRDLTEPLQGPVF